MSRNDYPGGPDQKAALDLYAARINEQRMSIEGDRVDVADGKYTVVIGTNGDLFSLRNGEMWRDFSWEALNGDKLVYHLAAELRDARNLLQRGLNAWNVQFEGEQDDDPWCVEARALLHAAGDRS